jgi:cellulose 1,4-beta-cellobiosidase
VAGTTQVAIYWSPSTDNVGVAGYYVFRDGTQIARTALPNYFDTGLSPGTSHVYVVRAFDAGGNVSSGSSNLNAKTVALSTSSTGTVAGVVYSSAGRPLANVVVTLSGYGITKTTKTGNTGVYKFTSLAAGTYTLTVTTTGTTTTASPPGTSVTSTAGQTLVLVASS